MTYPSIVDCESPFYHSYSLQVVESRAVMMVSCAGRDDSIVVVFDARSGDVIREFPDTIGQMARLSPDGARLAVQTMATNEGLLETVMVFDVATGVVVSTMAGLCRWDGEDDSACAVYPEQPFADWIQTLKFSPDGRLAGTGPFESAGVHVWDVETGELIHTWRDPDGLEGPFGIEFSPDGSLLNLGLVTTLRAFDTTDWSMTTTFDAVDSGDGTAPGMYFAYTSDGSTIAAAADAFWGVGDLFLFDGSDMAVALTIRSAHSGGIRALAVSPDDSKVASVGLDGMARVHEISTGELVTEIPVVLDAQANNVQFLDNETLIVTAGNSGAMYQLTLDEGALLTVARARLTRTFSDQECATYQIDPCPALEDIRSR